ncbi:jerky protein homolog-like [Anthonomus grandis grandis]|uniref:jerky protein homolog-like n=1 Tax=Anthonomus grandis grandis TaxID=2921223 RepID=UPI002165C8F9|nr:jerky protein homolog-like [Anthonomus grandis grandis]
MPEKDWCTDFLTRHKDVLKVRLAENIRRSRAGVSRKVLYEYFDKLDVSLKDVTPENLINYDETNFVADAGRPKVGLRRTMKHAEKVCESTKSAHSVMFSVTAAGLLSPQYVVYKSENLWSTWTQSGPEGCIYNRSKSGWFDQSLFEDWFFKIIVPYYRRLDGPKAIIGDNLASHLSEAVIKKCKEKNIRFIFLPANSTHLTQPSS